MPLFHTDELYFWLATYEDGFSRRSLIGTCLHPLMQAATAGDVRAVVLTVWLGAGALALVVLAGMAWRLLAGTEARRGALVILIVAASVLPGLLAFHAGYPDTIIALLVLGFGLRLRSVAPSVLGAELVFCGLVHDLAFFLLAPAALLSLDLWPRGTLRSRFLFSAGLLVALSLPALPFSAPQPDLIGRLTAAGLGGAAARAQEAIYLHQTAWGEALKMAGVWRAHWLNGLFGVAYAALPAVAICLLGWPAARACIGAAASGWGRRAVEHVLYVVACVGVVALLAVSWDVARIAAFATLSAFVTVHGVMAARPVRPPGRVGTAAALAVVVVYALLPVMNVYFDYGRLLNGARVASVCAPCRDGAGSFLDWFNRGLPPADQSALVFDKAFNN